MTKLPTHEHFAVLIGDAGLNGNQYVGFHSQTDAEKFISDENKVFLSQFTDRDYEQGDAPEFVYMTRNEFKADHKERFAYYLECESIETAVEFNDKLLEEITINVTELCNTVANEANKGLVTAIDSDYHVCELRGTKYRSWHDLAVAVELDITDYIECI